MSIDRAKIFYDFSYSSLVSQEERGSLCRSLLGQGMIRQGEAHQANVYPRRILMRRASRGPQTSILISISQTTHPLILRITFNSRYLVTSVLNNRGTTQFASFASKAYEFNEGELDDVYIKRDTKHAIFTKIFSANSLLVGFYLTTNSVA